MPVRACWLARLLSNTIIASFSIIIASLCITVPGQIPQLGPRPHTNTGAC
jgi:hypothetical protein